LAGKGGEKEAVGVTEEGSGQKQRKNEEGKRAGK
jgi:hypothetical protein